jgi:hypothetical protein
MVASIEGLSVIETQPIVSIIVVNWNGEKYLPGCLDGIFSQSYTESEVILIDNASMARSSGSSIGKEYRLCGGQ